ncbi:MAG: outer membrane lipoprotein-sorting protein [Verrucomicrobia bacterium]|nr:outer membrane lipoprotein-sorting protein [Verrucomicrobiota bacterium]
MVVAFSVSLSAFGQGAKIVEPPKPDYVAGEKLRAQLLAQQPAESSLNGLLKLRDADGNRREIRVHLTTRVLTNGAWEAAYDAGGERPEKLTVRHSPSCPNVYSVEVGSGSPVELGGAKIFGSFAGSDFSPADLGLDFLHWPKQAIVGTGLQQGRPYKVLESTTTNASPNGYTRVRSRVDNETGGITQADAFDAKGKIKDFSLIGWRKVEGVWQLRGITIVDERKDSVTRLEFELTVKDAER